MMLREVAVGMVSSNFDFFFHREINIDIDLSVSYVVPERNPKCLITRAVYYRFHAALCRCHYIKNVFGFEKCDSPRCAVIQENQQFITFAFVSCISIAL